MAVAVAVAMAALASGAAAAAARTNECNGLQTCVPVAGPWIVVPIAGGASRPHAEYRLSCPAGFIVGGIDVELADPAIDVAFLGRSGSPVNPGITTERAAVFVATYVGAGGPVASFRPHLGCIPASGGGTRVPTVSGAAAARQSVVRRSRDVRLRPGARQVIAQRCAAGERLVGSSAAVGFYTAAPPTARVASAVQLGARTLGRAAVHIVVRTTAAARGIRVVAQVAAVCAGPA